MNPRTVVHDWSGSRILPLHIQLIPTNRCNSRCEWCSCSAVDRQIELPTQEILDLLTYFEDLGTRAVTITGGGEPSLHPGMPEIFKKCEQLGIKIGVVTNGLIWSRDAADYSYLNYATWMRISVTDTRNAYDTGIITQLAAKVDKVDIGISFTVPWDDVNLDTAQDICKLAHATPNITHIRFVNDVLNPNPTTLNNVRNACSWCDKAIFQDRSTYTTGTKNCLISLLKPIIDATGLIYPCCGVQYATEELRRLPEKMSMGRWTEFHKRSNFDGSGCKKCYYSSYNTALQNLTQPIPHPDFV